MRISGVLYQVTRPVSVGIFQSIMDDRSENMKMSRSSGASRKNKKRGSKKGIIRTDTWCSEDQTDCPDSSAPPLDYGQIFWQQPGGIPPHLQPHNGQRLFTAMSDPSVCGYSPMPMAYTMEPVSMPPIYPLYRPVPQPNYRPFRGRARRSPQHHQNIPNVINGYSSLQENRTGYSTPNSYQNGDYASLPPTANNEVRRDGEEMNNSEHRRYSDPGLGPADLDNSRESEDSDSGESGSSITTVGKNNKLVLSLVEQLTNLRESNSRMFKELHETKLSLEHVKAELCRVKQHASMDYQPGMLSDIISEMREANKMFEETMNTRIAAIVEEKYNQRLMEIEGVKERLGKITDDKIDGDRRISKLEEEVARLRINANNEGREIAAFEEETLALRRELQEARSSRHLAENHTIKLEKLVEILRKKMNGATNEKTVADIKELISSGIIGTTGAADDLATSGRETDTDNEDDDSDYEKFSHNNDSVLNNISLTGPVTDL